MRSAEYSDAWICRTPIAASRSLIAASLFLGLSILYQVYFFDFSDGELSGGGVQRFLLKVGSAALFFVSIRKYLSLSVFSVNLVLKLPLLFVAATIFVLTPFLAAAYTQALNLLFFLPVFFIDWNRPGGTRLHTHIWGVIAAVVTVQLILDPIFKFYFEAGWSNAAVIGGMGNPNVFGIFLIASGLALAFLVDLRWRYLATPLFLATILTGSLASAMVGFTCLLGQLAVLSYRAPFKGMIVLGGVVALAMMSTLALEFVTGSESIGHAFNKLLALQELLSSGSSADSESIAVRMDYLNRGLGMISDSPISLLVGHPGGRPMYNGDGLWVSFFVTYGLPVTLYFLAVNLVVIYRAVMSRSRDLMFSGCIIATMLAFFVTNRILDYWPAALIYVLGFSYLTTRGVRRRDQSPTQGISLE